MVIYVELFKKNNNISITKEDIIENMSYIDNLLNENNNTYILNNIYKKNPNYFIILSIILVILFILIYYIKYFLINKIII